MSYGVHICTFVGKRLPPEPGPLGKCGLCSKRAVGGALFAWGAAALCAKHLDEECGPDDGERLPPVDLDTWEGCDACFEGKLKLRCSMVKGQGHGSDHKRITRTGRVTHTWPATPAPGPATTGEKT